MSLPAKIFKTSVGKKHIVGLTGLSLCVFAITHLAGNFLLFSGAEAFNEHERALTSLPGFTFIRYGLLAVFVIHAVFAIWVSIENNRARPRRYISYRGSRKFSWGATSMRYTGPALFVYLVVHLINIRFHIYPAVPEGTGLYEVVLQLFQDPFYVGFYCVMMLLFGFHMAHGFQSSLQSLGVIKADMIDGLEKSSIVFGVVMALGYAILPIYMFMQHSG